MSGHHQIVNSAGVSANASGVRGKGASPASEYERDGTRTNPQEDTTAAVCGTNASDVLDAIDGVTNSADFIYGFNGNDTLKGFGGDDHITGGYGADAIYGGNGTDAPPTSTPPRA